MKALAAALALALTIGCFVPYVVAISRGCLRPSAVTWSIWALGTLLVVGAQASAGAGIGALPLALSACLSGGVAVLAAVRGGDLRPAPCDLACLAGAAGAALAWLATDDALLAVVLLTALDLVGFGPLLRRAWSRPDDESALFYLAGAVRNALLLCALDARNATTVLFPAVVGLACVGVSALLMVRRRTLQRRVAT